jgi:hypothetical protein
MHRWGSGARARSSECVCVRGEAVHTSGLVRRAPHALKGNVLPARRAPPVYHRVAASAECVWRRRVVKDVIRLGLARKAQVRHVCVRREDTSVMYASTERVCVCERV